MSIQRRRNFGQEPPRGPRFRPKPKWCPLGNAHAPRYGNAERRQRIPKVFSRRAEHPYSDARNEEREQRVVNDTMTMLAIGSFFRAVWHRIFPPHKPARIDPNLYHVDGGVS